ncbi:hypothetical protein ALI144C_36255 [Actinosynnema sp. ALI-1.44]|nr:hypothetical protein ALI144C_36255 [Actinosynnema sp. ALI-1.44]
MEVLTSSQIGSCVVRPLGVLDSTTYRTLRDALVKLAVEEPDALVVDLDELDIAQESVLTVFSSVWMRVSEWPGVPILLAGGRPHQQPLLAGAIVRYTPRYPTVAAALAAVGSPPPRRRAVLELDAGATDSRVARAFTDQVCREWHLSDYRMEAMAVANELVDNVTDHAGTGCRLRLELRDRMLTVAVRDGSPRKAAVRERLGGDWMGNGLRIVAGIAYTWGCTPDLDGGKVVWAVVRCSPPTDRRHDAP